MAVDDMSEVQGKRVAVIHQALSGSSFAEVDIVPCRIEKGLYLGSFGAAKNKRELQSENVTHILTVASSLEPVYPNDFKYKVLDVLDREGTNITQYFDECFEFIDEAKRMGGGVLVHCFVGKSRSVTIVVAYLMKKYAMSVSQALWHVREKRPIASPNSGFLDQLLNYESSIEDYRKSKKAIKRKERRRIWLLNFKKCW